MIGWTKALAAASGAFGVPEASIIGVKQTGRGRPVGTLAANTARQVLMYLFRERGEHAQEIAKQLGRDTSAVYHAHRKIARLLGDEDNGSELRQQVGIISAAAASVRPRKQLDPAHHS